MTMLAAKLQTMFDAKREKGATAVEYGLMVALIAVAIITTVGLLGTNLSTMFNNVATKIGAVVVP